MTGQQFLVLQVLLMENRMCKMLLIPGTIFCAHFQGEPQAVRLRTKNAASRAATKRSCFKKCILSGRCSPVCLRK